MNRSHVSVLSAFVFGLGACSSGSSADTGAPVDARDAGDAGDIGAPSDVPMAIDARDVFDAPAPLDATDATDIPTPPDTSPADAPDAATMLDWFPGHYVLLGAGTSMAVRDMYLTGTIAAPFEGEQIQYTWPQCESTEGVYDSCYAAIDADLAAAEAAHKHIIIMLQYKSFGMTPGTTPPAVPAYLLGPGPWCVTPTGDASTMPVCGQYETNNGAIAMIWNTEVANRMHAWFTHLGMHYAPGGAGAMHAATIAGFVLPESASGNGPSVTLADVDYTSGGYVGAMEDNLTALIAAFPTKPAFQYINFLPGSTSETTDLRAMGTWALGIPHAGLGCPDVGDPSMYSPPGYATLLDPAFQGRLPFDVAVEQMDFMERTTDLPDTYTSATAPGMRGMAAQIVVWSNVTAPAGNLFTIGQVSTYIAARPFPNTAAPTY